MHIYTNTSFTGHWPVGSAVVVTARSRIHAAELLEKTLETMGLKQTIDPKKMVLMDAAHANVRVLCDGNY